MKPKNFIQSLLLASLLLVLTDSSQAALAGVKSILAALPAEMNYHAPTELDLRLHQLEITSDYVKLVRIGNSPHYRLDPDDPPLMPISALRISADTPDSVDDNSQKNSILFECGMHAREWLTTESCLELAEYLIDNRLNTNTPVPELLSYVDVWIVPMSNPSGRMVDDLAFGDPTRFYNTPPMELGWRGNSDDRLCATGVDVARNFSRGFNAYDAHIFCDRMYRGPAPFSTSEANALRQFVENHMISMAIVLHTTSQELWNLWGTGDIAGNRMIEETARIWRSGWANPADQISYDLDRNPLGTESGQFSAWLGLISEDSGDKVDSSSGPWALNGDLPLAGDFDRDGNADDVSVYRPSNDRWYYDFNHNATTDQTIGPWLIPDGRPFVGDFNRDGKLDDTALFDFTSGTWYIDFFHNGITDRTYAACGTACQHPVAIDYDGDGFVDDRISFCSSDKKWYVDIDLDCVGDGISPIGPWGLSEDRAVAGDFDRDGSVDDLGLFRPSTQVWYYDLDHDGNTDHASGPWGTATSQPFAGDFNGNSEAIPEDVGLFDGSTRTWSYDEFHNATIHQLDDGTLRAIQTIIIELVFKDAVYVAPYRNFPTDSSNRYHPSGNAVWDVIEDSFIPMAEYLIRQSRSPGCPTLNNGASDSSFCPQNDVGLVGAKLIPSANSHNSAGVLEGYPAKWISWGQVLPSWEQLPAGEYKLVYRVQNFGASTVSPQINTTVTFVHCSSPGSCSQTVYGIMTTLLNIGARGARTGTLTLDLTRLTGPGEWYEITMNLISPDDLSENNRKVFKFLTVARTFLPMIFKR